MRISMLFPFSLGEGRAGERREDSQRGHDAKGHFVKIIQSVDVASPGE